MEYLTDADFETAEKNGIKKYTAYQRFYRSGWSKEKAITHSVTPKLNLWNQYKGKCVVSDSTFYERVKKGMPPDKAASTPSMHRRAKNGT